MTRHVSFSNPQAALLLFLIVQVLQLTIVPHLVSHRKAAASRGTGSPTYKLWLILC